MLINEVKIPVQELDSQMGEGGYMYFQRELIYSAYLYHFAYLHYYTVI